MTAQICVTFLKSVFNSVLFSPANRWSKQLFGPWRQDIATLTVQPSMATRWRLEKPYRTRSAPARWATAGLPWHKMSPWGVDRTLLSFLFWNVKTLTFYQTISGRVVCASGPETRGRVHHIQAVEHPTSPRGRGAGPPEDSEGPEAGVPGPLPHPLALRLPVSSTSANV